MKAVTFIIDHSFDRICMDIEWSLRQFLCSSCRLTSVIRLVQWFICSGRLKSNENYKRIVPSLNAFERNFVALINSCSCCIWIRCWFWESLSNKYFSSSVNSMGISSSAIGLEAGLMIGCSAFSALIIGAGTFSWESTDSYFSWNPWRSWTETRETPWPISCKTSSCSLSKEKGEENV